MYSVEKNGEEIVNNKSQSYIKNGSNKVEKLYRLNECGGSLLTFCSTVNGERCHLTQQMAPRLSPKLECGHQWTERALNEKTAFVVTTTLPSLDWTSSTERNMEKEYVDEEAVAGHK